MTQSLLVAGFVLATVLAAPTGWWLGGRSRAVWVPAACLLLAVTVAYPLVARRPDVLLALYPSRDFAAIDSVWFVPFAVGFLGLASRQVDRRTTRVTAGLLSAFLVVLGAGSALWVASGARLALRHSVDEEGVVRQTTGYTCGAAAAATLCRRLGVPMTEADMAVRAGVVPGCGTTMVKVYWALRDALGDRVRSVRLLHARDVRPGAVPTPCVAELRVAPWLNHLVLVREVRADAVVIEDPEAGLTRVPLAEAQAMWRGPIVAVDCGGQALPLGRLVDRNFIAAPAAPSTPAPAVPHELDLPALSSSARR